MTSTDIFRGWAWMAARGEIDLVPEWIKDQAHVLCNDPVTSWLQLVHAERDLKDLAEGIRTTQQITGEPLVTSEQTLWTSEARARRASECLAWGDHVR